VSKSLSLQERIQQVERRIAEACVRAGRSREEVELIAVTKYVSQDTTKAVLDQGINHIGENRWQDAKEKWEALGERGIWHFIGHLQTNKVKDILGRFAWIHSLDRLSLAKEIEKRASKEGLIVPCLIQLNVSGEESKHGMDPERLPEFLLEVREMQHIELKGFMTMAPFEDDPEAIRPVFRKLRQIRNDVNEKYNLNLVHLSMGMSNDFEVAIEEGATMIRLGSILVGREK
jgi:pyridoxal phosphate enzyme (YggS family)